MKEPDPIAFKPKGKCIGIVPLPKNKHRKCKQYAMSGWNGCNLCFAHFNQKHRELNDDYNPGEPWAAMCFTINPPINLMMPSSVSTLRSMLRHGPNSDGKHEGDGFIYVYTLDSDTRHGDPWYKIGRTTQSVHARLDGWPGSRLKKSWRVKWNIYCETLIHRFLEHWRAYRMVLPAAKQAPGQYKRYLSMWYNGVQHDSRAKSCFDIVPDWVVHGHKTRQYNVDTWLPTDAHTTIDRNVVTCDDVAYYPKGKSKTRYTLEKEWFYCEWDYIERVIHSIVDVVNLFQQRHNKAFIL